VSGRLKISKATGVVSGKSVIDEFTVNFCYLELSPPNCQPKAAQILESFPGDG
jgi:hypothetical protein